MTTLLLVFVTLRVITAAVSVEVSGEDIPVRVSRMRLALRTGCWVLGTEPGAVNPRDRIPPFLALSWSCPFSSKGERNCSS